MIPLLALASIPTIVWSADLAALDANKQVASHAKNTEFIWNNYPPGALKRGEQGRVAFRVTIDRTGLISACEVTESSGFRALDRETCEMMSLYAQAKPGRDAAGHAIRSQQDGFIVWKLPPGATKVASAPTSKVAPKPDAIICRRDISTGSLIATTKMCLSRYEWDRETDAQKQHRQDMQGKFYTSGG